MHSYVDYCWHKTFLNRIIKILICFCLVYTPFFANAGAAEKWEILEHNYDHTKNTVNLTAKKLSQQAANSGVYKVQVPVSASTLGSTVKRMLWAGVAVSAVSALVEGVGWIIDVGSKTIKKPKDTSPDLPTFEYIYLVPDGNVYTKFSNNYEAAQYTCNKTAKSYGWIVVSCTADSKASPTFEGSLIAKAVIKRNASSNPENFEWLYLRTKNPKYNPAEEPQFDIISDSQLGDEILGNGTEPNSKPEPSPDIIISAYSPNNPVSDAPAPQETNQALENANPEPESPPKGDSKPKPNTDTDGDGKPDAYDPAKPSEGTDFTLPAFCSWAPAVCEFFNVQKQDNKDLKENQKEDIAQNKTFFDSVKDFFDWTKENPDIPDDSQPPQITPIDIGQLDTGTFKATAGCPGPIQVPVSFGKGGNVEISYEPICSFASKWSFVAPLIGFLSGAMIIVGVGRKGEDGEI